MSAAELRPYPPGLIDVLEQLPRDVCRNNLWLRLLEVASPHNSVRHDNTTVGRAFRLASRRSLLLADGWTDHLRLLLATTDEVPAHGAFLARQTGLGELSLQVGNLDDSEALISDTLRLGGAASHHLRVLHLDSAYVKTKAASGQAVRLYCPNLQELRLSVVMMSSRFFKPFYDCEHLSTVEFGSPDFDLECAGILRALATLPSLTALYLSGTLGAADASLLTHLTGLRVLRLDNLTLSVDPEDGPRLGTVLTGLSRLTRLALPRCDDDEEQAACEAVQLAMVAQLGALRSLTSLRVVQDDAGLHGDALAGLCRLSGLTKLTCPALGGPAAEAGPATGAGGCLPLLRHLKLTGQLSSSSLAATLRLLAPLPHLLDFDCALFLDRGPYEEERNIEDDAEERAQGDSAGARAVVDAWQAATILARAPQMRRLSLTLGCHSRDGGEAGVAGVATAALSPLLDRLTNLSLADLPHGMMDVLWPVVCLGSRLVHLDFVCCWVTRSGLQSVVEHMPGLRSLCVRYCKGAVGATCVALAAVRVQPLRVYWLPDLDEEHSTLFREQARCGVELEGKAR